MTGPRRPFTARRSDDVTLTAAFAQYDHATRELRHQMRAQRLARRVRLGLYYAMLFAFTVAALVILGLRLYGHANVFSAALVAAGLWLAAGSVAALRSR